MSRDGRGEWIFLVPHALRLPRLGNRLLQGAYILLESFGIFFSVISGFFANCHWLGHRVNFEPVMLDFPYFVPRESRGIFDRSLKLRCRVAIGNDIKPKAIPAIFGDTTFVRSQQDRAGLRTDSLDL